MRLMGRVSEVSDRMIAGASAGLTLRYVGLLGRFAGSCATRGVDRGLHVARGRIDVPRQIELQHHARAAQSARRGHLRHAGDAPELAFERRRDGGRHRFRAGARQRGAHDDGRVRDLRQRGDRQVRERQRTRERQRERRAGSWPPDAG